MKVTESELLSIIIEEVLDEKKKKKKAKRDACYHKVRSRYDVWPSAYASGALVKCRKVGAKNWGKTTTKEELELYEGKESLEAKIRNALIEEGGAAGMKALKDHTEASEKEIKDAIEEMQDVGLHRDGDYILQDDKEIDVKKNIREKKRKKAGSESSKESSLRDWFGRRGAKGKKKGWVDCNAPDGKGGYKSCGRSQGEERKRYPACRPTPAACKERGRGKSWGKKDSKKKNEGLGAKRGGLEAIIVEELQKALFKPGLMQHVKEGIPVSENIYRPGSPCYFNVIKQARDYYKKGLYEALNEEERDLLENSELGEWAVFEGERVPLDFPLFVDEVLSEKKSKKKKDPPLNKPSRNTGSGKKYKVFVRDPKTGNIRKVSYGDAKGGLKGGWNSAEARKSFAARHNCAEKSKKPNKRLTAGYWACRAHKDFGPGVGRFW
jgi:hypothetical protein